MILVPDFESGTSTDLATPLSNNKLADFPSY